MIITFYDCTADKKRVNKRRFMTEKITLNSFEPINAVDIVKPVFTLEYKSTIPLTYNYCYIDNLKRYYYILSMSQDPGNLITVRCLEDIRMSKIDGNDFELTVIRNEHIKNSKIVDKSLPVDPQYHEPEVTPWSSDIFQYPLNEMLLGGQPRYYDVLETQ